MTYNDIVRIAMEAGIGFSRDFGPTVSNATPDTLKRFAALVAANEREECAKVCENEGGRVDASWVSCADAIRARSNP